MKKQILLSLFLIVADLGLEIFVLSAIVGWIGGWLGVAVAVIFLMSRALVDGARLLQTNQVVVQPVEPVLQPAQQSRFKSKFSDDEVIYED